MLRIIAAGGACQDHETAIALGGGGDVSALLERIDALEAENEEHQREIVALKGELANLAGAHADLADDVGGLSATQTTLDAQVPDCLSSDETEVYFTGCNVNILSGSGATDGEINGLGNLVIGYNESDDTIPAIRTGSHNLVVGPYHSYSSYGGLVAGWDNTIRGAYSSISGGGGSLATGQYSSISGGAGNTASGLYSSVSGGYDNIANDNGTSVSGGAGNTASGLNSSVSGGNQNTASGDYSAVGGGTGLTAGSDSQFRP